MKRAARGMMGLVGAALTLAGCSGLDMLDAVTSRSGYVAERDVPYGPLPRQRLDIYRPSAGVDPAKPVVVFFYGGAWKWGERAQYRFVGQSLAEAGFVTIIPDYRLYPQARLPEFVGDGAAATAWVAAHVPGASGHIVVAGHSAGAFIAAMLACDHRYLDAAGSSRKVLAGLIGMAGPYSFTPDGENIDILAVPDGRPNMPAAAVDGGEPPTLLLAAEGDTVVYPINSEKLAARMAAAGDQVEYRHYPGLDHARLVAALGTAMSFMARPVRADVIAFLNKR